MAVMVAALMASSVGGITATIDNQINHVSTGSFLLTVAQGATTQCTSATSPITAATGFGCSGSWLPPTVAATGSTPASETISNSGSVTPTKATFSATSCGPVQLANAVSSTPADPMLVRGGVTYANVGPMSGSASYGTDGVSGFASEIQSSTAPVNFTVATWFKTSTAGGALMGFGSSPSALGDASADRMLWIDPSGQLSFGIIDSTPTKDTVTTPLGYADNAWHLASVTVAYSPGLLGVLPVASTLTETIYVGGAAVITKTFNLGVLGLLLGSIDSYTGYWHAGWSPVTTGGWTPAPTSNYFNGFLADATVVPSTVSAANEASFASHATSQAAYVANAAALGASALWPLSDSGTTSFSGTVPYLSAPLCAQIGALAGGGTFCAYTPNSATAACPLGSSPTVTAMVTATSANPAAFPPTNPGTPSALTISLARESTYDTTNTPGLHLLVPATISEALGTWLDTFSWTSSQTIV